MKTKQINLIYVFIFINFAFIGGLLEAFSYFNDGMFTFMQTGNLVSIFYNLFNVKGYAYLYPLISLILFILDILLVLFLKKKIVLNNKIDYNYFSIILMIVIGFIYLFIPRNLIFNEFDFSKLISIFLNTFFGIVLLNTFTYFNDILFVPTMMTNNIRMLTSLFFKYENEHEKIELRKFNSYLIVILSFVIGVVLSFAFLFFKDYLFEININGFDFTQNFIYVIALIFLFLNLILIRIIKKNLKLDGKLNTN